MKYKTILVPLIYIIASVFIAIISFKFSCIYIKQETIGVFNLVKDCAFVIFTGVLFYFVLQKNNTQNKLIFNKLKKNNDEVKESNDKYNIVTMATSDTIWDWKLKEDNFSWNKGIETVFGYNAGQIKQSSTWWFERIHPEDSIKMSIRLYSFIEQKTDKWQDTYRFKCADGTYKYVLDRGFLIKDENGKSMRMIGAIQDISKQKEEEQRLLLLETAITQSKDSIMITEASSKNNSIPNIIYTNPAFTTMTGFSEDEAIGQIPPFFNSPNSDLKTLATLLEAINNSKECHIETLSLTKNNKEYWALLSMIPVLNKENEISHWISIQREITEDKKRDKEKEQLIRELTQNNNDLKQFSYITSHNLRAPLSNLNGLLTLLEEIPIDNLELQEILEGFKKSTNLLNETISDLVKIIIIKDTPSINREKISIEEVFKKTCNQIQFQINQHKPLISLHLTDCIFIETNRAYLESILLNLLTNAIKYKSKERKLEITLTSKETHFGTVLKFEDNGIGIDLKRNKDKIFGLYQRFHSYPDSKGLGLYLVKSQIETMGGTIAVESEVNKGTTFILTFKNNKQC